MFGVFISNEKKQVIEQEKRWDNSFEIISGDLPCLVWDLNSRLTFPSPPLTPYMSETIFQLLFEFHRTSYMFYFLHSVKPQCSTPIYCSGFYPWKVVDSSLLIHLLLMLLFPPSSPPISEVTPMIMNLISPFFASDEYNNCINSIENGIKDRSNNNNNHSSEGPSQVNPLPSTPTDVYSSNNLYQEAEKGDATSSTARTWANCFWNADNLNWAAELNLEDLDISLD